MPGQRPCRATRKISRCRTLSPSRVESSNATCQTHALPPWAVGDGEWSAVRPPDRCICCGAAAVQRPGFMQRSSDSAAPDRGKRQDVAISSSSLPLTSSCAAGVRIPSALRSRVRSRLSGHLTLSILFSAMPEDRRDAAAHGRKGIIFLSVARQSGVSSRKFSQLACLRGTSRASGTLSHAQLKPNADPGWHRRSLHFPFFCAPSVPLLSLPSLARLLISSAVYSAQSSCPLHLGRSEFDWG
jgi:hypothetical protein